MTKDEKSLLLFFECAAVDYGGLLSTGRMNDDDRKLAARWAEEGFIIFERVASKHITPDTAYPKNYAVILSENAWRLAHEERIERSGRVYTKRNWKTISEYRQQQEAE